MQIVSPTVRKPSEKMEVGGGLERLDLYPFSDFDSTPTLASRNFKLGAELAIENWVRYMGFLNAACPNIQATIECVP